MTLTLSTQDKYHPQAHGVQQNISPFHFKWCLKQSNTNYLTHYFQTKIMTPLTGREEQRHYCLLHYKEIAAQSGNSKAPKIVSERLGDNAITNTNKNIIKKWSCIQIQNDSATPRTSNRSKFQAKQVKCNAIVMVNMTQLLNVFAFSVLIKFLLVCFVFALTRVNSKMVWNCCLLKYITDLESLPQTNCSWRWVGTDVRDSVTCFILSVLS